MKTKGKIINHISAIFLGIGYGLNAIAIMKRDNIDSKKACIKAANSIIDTCRNRIIDIVEDVITDVESHSFNIGYFTDEGNQNEKN
jgi:hypothetical protein